LPVLFPPLYHFTPYLYLSLPFVCCDAVDMFQRLYTASTDVALNLNRLDTFGKSSTLGFYWWTFFLFCKFVGNWVDRQLRRRRVQVLRRFLFLALVICARVNMEELKMLGFGRRGLKYMIDSCWHILLTRYRHWYLSPSHFTMVRRWCKFIFLELEISVTFANPYTLHKRGLVSKLMTHCLSIMNDVLYWMCKYILRCIGTIYTSQDLHVSLRKTTKNNYPPRSCSTHFRLFR